MFFLIKALQWINIKINSHPEEKKKHCDVEVAKNSKHNKYLKKLKSDYGLTLKKELNKEKCFYMKKKNKISNKY